MSLKKISKVQPELFEYTSENLQKARNEITKYPKNYPHNLNPKEEVYSLKIGLNSFLKNF